MSESSLSASVSPTVYSPTFFPTLVLDENELLLDCYSDRLSRVLSIYNGAFSPFRATVLSSWTRSPLLFPLFKFLAGAYQLNLTGERSFDLVVNEARISTLHQLSLSLAKIDSISSIKRVELMLVIVMFGLSSSWYDLNDLGLAHYNAAARLLKDVNVDKANVPLQNYQYFEECLIYWWMMLSFACDPSLQVIERPPRLVPKRAVTTRWIPHPLTGISSQVQYLLGQVGYLVFAQRRRILAYPLTTTENLLQSLSDIEKARGLEGQLQLLDLPPIQSIVDPKDPHTPVVDLVNMANAYRICGLLLLYHAFPDLLQAKLASEAKDETPGSFSSDKKSRQQFLVSLALYVLQILGENNEDSGTRTIEAILLVIVAGELSSVPSNGTTPQVAGGHIRNDAMSGDAHPQARHDKDNTRLENSVQEARSAVLARFERVQSVLPFKTIDRMRMLVSKTWGLMDQGNDIFWVDVMIESKWQFLMI